MRSPTSRRGTPARALGRLALLCAVAVLASCGTQGDDTLGVSLIEDRADRKAVRYVSPAADTSTSFQATAAADAAGSNSLLVSARPGYLSRALVRFPSSVLAAGPVESAEIVFPFRGGFGASPFSLAIHRVTAGWTETVILPDAFPAYDSLAIATIDVPFGGGASLDTFRLDVGAVAQAWASDTTSNFGIALVPAEGEDGELEIDARSSGTPPRLTIRWSVAGADTVRTVVPEADVHSLGTTAAFVPLSQQPRRITIARGLAGRAFVRFPWTDPPPRSTIHRAELTLHPDPALSSANGFAIAVRRVLAEPWSGFGTSVDPLLEGVRNVLPAPDSVVLDVTNVLVALLDAPNHGFEIRATDEGVDTDYLRFHGFDTEVPALAPTLRVWWTPGDRPGDAP